MLIFTQIGRKLGKHTRLIITIYPIIIILLIPALLILNTIWNLKSFNRDVNFLLRHQAVMVADSIKPFIVDYQYNSFKLTQIIRNLDASNEDILSIVVLKKEGNTVSIYTASVDKTQAEDSKTLALNQLALGFNQPFAGLAYDAHVKRNIWNVVTPLDSEGIHKYLLYIKLDTKTVSEILNRTSQDSMIVLSGLIIVTLFFIVNHFYFYLSTLKAHHLEELDRLKSEFVSMTAHELRTPMTVLKGYLELLKHKLQSDELKKVKTYFDRVDTVTQDLSDIIADLLDVSRIEQGRLETNVENIQMNTIITDVVDRLRPMAEEKGLNIIYSQQNLPIVKSDPARIKQILTNLISNAVKYTLKGTITVAVNIKNNEIHTVVKDTGIGIPPVEMSKLFTKFHRIKDNQTQQIRGTGLGLWITKKMIEMLGGKIYVESMYGSGTSITFTLPINSV